MGVVMPVGQPETRELTTVAGGFQSGVIVAFVGGCPFL
ncbi:hypothetical protein CASFOL_031815 [Castilleja foliolosa]|uniref:Uncharacterized protein n=1 Tax=Castilleja foliolosa TaxID=1961234 RepID=A0ABD3C0M1_9LAMI